MEVEIKPTKNKGRGVFAKYLIKEGEQHTSEGILLEANSLYRNSIISLYSFCSQLARDVLLVFDWPSLLNQSDDPNLTYEPSGNQLILTALRDIEPGEELTIYYNWDINESAQKLGIDINKFNNENANNTKKI